jgi:hypothetical protein
LAGDLLIVHTLGIIDKSAARQSIVAAAFYPVV